ncbi:MAG: PAS domain S-box protein [Nannocystis sp.]|uniref:chemotaxis protein CheB n=1 Tax=Nannocystis sp. TaxID=1962667 RepID=UPI002429DF1D|nr:chemotaxis protein CheB [Nannocystis sp.]MBK9754016.1 PAS domain S-box protein [Nannocystis sp.]
MSANEAKAAAPVAFPIVGVGASAGGLAATTELLRHLGAAPGVSIVVVHHLDPSHDSGLVELLARVAGMTVSAVVDGERVAKDHIHVLPPGVDVTIARGIFHLAPRDDRAGLHLPIDRFFESLAADQDAAAVGVVLSGTGFDGTNGIRAINAAGGVTFAQDATAQHAGMPTSAVATGCVSAVLDPEGIARELTRLGQHPPALLAQAPTVQVERALWAIASLMRKASGIEFTNYKQATLLRRIERRIFLAHLSSLGEYAELLQRSPDELRALCEDVLIHVTGFFRDPEVYESLAKTVFPRLIEHRDRDAPIRVWVPGCSSGEEVYSLAIMLREFLAAAGSEVPLKIFGTDVSLTIVDRARAARYPASIERDVSPARLQQFFTAVPGGFQISRAIRDCCVFARHDITRDPPFSRLDLISCRNLMIYLGTTLQERVLPLFHYALNEPGFLVLGSSETVRSFAGFVAVDAKHRIYARSSAAPRVAFDFSDRRSLDEAPPPSFASVTPSGAHDLHREADRLVLAHFAPPGVVVTDDLAIVHFRGQTGAFIEPTPGAASLDLMRLVREELRLGLRQAIDAARARSGPASATARLTSSHRVVDIEVIPFASAGSQQRFFVVLFKEAPEPAASVPPPGAAPTGAEPLAEELASTRRYLESVIEQLEASNEELKAANEEIVSSNEELRSTNEELQTAKEELQATNEELRTVNDEMNDRNVEKSRLNDDLVNVLTSVEMPIVLLGRDLRVRRFTPAAAQVFRLVATDVGRPFTDIKPLVREPDVASVAAQVLERLTASTTTGQDDQGRWYQTTIRPYVTADNRIDGVILCAVDIDAVKKAGERLSEARTYAEGVVDTVHECLLVLGPDLRVRSANRAFFRAFALSADETLGARLGELGRGALDLPQLKDLLARLDAGGQVEDVLVEQDLASGRRAFMVSARRIEPGPLVLLALADVSARHQAEEALLRSEHQFRDVLTTAAQAILMVDPDGQIVFANDAADRLFGFARGELIGTAIDTLVPASARAAHAQLRAGYLRNASIRPMGPGRSLMGRTKAGAEFPIEVSLGTVGDAGRPLVVAFVEDLTRRRQAEAVIRDYQARLQSMAFDAAVVEEQERRRIAVDLHDRIAQSLALAQMKLGAVSQALSAVSRPELDQAIALLEQCGADARSLMFDLSPPVLYDLGLKQALSWLTEDFAKRHAIHVVLEGSDAEPPLDETTAALLFRAARELLMNVVKHAGTPAARVSLDWHDAHVSLAVEDDGVGFESSRPGEPSGGFGLFSVREQLGRLGGAVEVDSAPGTGTRVRLRVPLAAPDRKQAP